MKTVVIGGSGFIGGWLCDLLCEDPQVAEVVNYDKKVPSYPTGSPKYFFAQGLVTDRQGLEAVMDNAEEVYNMSGLLGTAELFNRMVEAVEVNVLGGVMVLDVARRLGVSRICWPTKPDKWPNMYTASKDAMEIFTKLYQGHYGLRVCVVEPWNAYGPKQTLWPVQKYVPTLVAQALLGRPIKLYGDGEHVARVFHVETAARMIIAACRSDDDNLGYGKDHLQVCGPAMTINQIARDIRDAANSESPIEYLPMRKGQAPEGLPEPPPGALETHKRLGVDFIEWQDGCPKTVAWYRDSYTDAQLEDALRRQDAFAEGQVQDG